MRQDLMKIRSEETLGVSSCFLIFLLTPLKRPPLTGKIIYNPLSSVKATSWNVLKLHIQFWIIFYNFLKLFLYLAWISCISSPSEFYGSDSIFNFALCILNVLICFQNGVQVACSPHVHDESPTIGFHNTNDCIC